MNATMIFTIVSISSLGAIAAMILYVVAKKFDVEIDPRIEEVEEVLPDLIGDYKHSELKDAKSVRMGDMLPTLVKAIQELSAKNDALEARLSALENG